MSHIYRKNDLTLSKCLSWLLRHSAVKEGLQITADGYVNVADVLAHKSLKRKYSVEDIKRVVETNDKQRFCLRYEGDSLQICANQGHSLSAIQAPNLIPLLGTEPIDVIHGTYYRNWKSIRKIGLSRMKRNHIHFASDLPKDKVTSGIRRGAEVFIYINLSLCISEGLQFYRSINNVILSPGNEKGVIEPKYFVKVCDSNGQLLL